MKKRILSIIIAAVTVFAAIPFASGCGGRREGVLTIWWPGGSQEIAALHRAAELYRELNPDVRFNIVPRPTTNFFMEYMFAVQGRNYPDIAFVDSVFVQQLAFEGIITNLSTFDAEINTDIREQIVESLWPANLYRGDAFALPVSANVLSLVYNKTLLRRVYQEVLGIEWTEDMVPTTWEELMAACEVIVQYNELQGLTGLDALIPYTIPAGAGNESMGAMAFVSMIERMGGRIMSEDVREMRLYSDEYREANLAAARKIQELGQRGFSTSTFQEQRFEAGTVGFIEMGSWRIDQYALITETLGHEFGFAPMVSLTEGGSNASALGLFSMVSTAGGINEALAVDFMKFFVTNDEVMLLHNKPQNLLPVTNSAIADEFFHSGDIWPVYREQLNHIVARPGSPAWAGMERQFAEFVTGLISGHRQPDYLRDLHVYFSRRLQELYR